MLLVQKYLLEHTFDNLAKEHGVYASFSKSGHKWSLNYDQIEAKNDDPIAKECRGLILAAEDGHSFSSEAIEINGKLSYDHICPGKTTILAFPFRRFFNYGQEAAANINWDDPQLSIQEKHDGTLCILYYDLFNNCWCVATRSVPEADQLMNNEKYTFRQLFEKALKETNGMLFDDWVKDLNKTFIYCFELTSPYNRIVVEYANTKLTWLMARSLNSRLEVDINMFDFGVGNIPRAKTYPLNTIESIIAYVASKNPSEHEGLVVCDGSFNRLKIKNPAYVVAHKLKSTIGASPRNMLECILLGKDDDIMSMLPTDLADDLGVMKKKLINLFNKYDLIYKEVLNTLENPSQKDFAIAIQKQNVWAPPFFKLHSKRANNMKDFVIKSTKDGKWSDNFLDTILELIEYNV